MRRMLFLLALAGCGGGGEDGWSGVRNPALGYEDVAIKDAFMVRGTDDVWRLGYSEIHADPFRFVLGFASSRDLVTFERGESLDQPETGGLASPDVVRAPNGEYVMTYNSHTTDVDGAAPKLYYRTSENLVTWSEPHRFHIEGADAPEDRLIDAAIAFVGSAAYLVFKREQTAAVAVSTLGDLDGPWTLLGDMTQGNIENYQLFDIDGRLHMLATTIPLLHDPTLYDVHYDVTMPRTVATFAVRPQAWNDGDLLAHEVANAAYLVDDRDHDGYWYLVYAGSTELETFSGRGHSSLGIARSLDLMTWEPAPVR